MASRLGLTGNSHRIYTQSANAISVMLTIVLLVSLRIESIFASYQYTYNTIVLYSALSQFLLLALDSKVAAMKVVAVY